MKMHYSHQLAPNRIAQIVGAFVLVPLLVLVFAGIFMAKAEHLFDRKYLLTSSLSKSYGLEPGAPVVVSGIRIGRVEQVDLNERGTVNLVLQLLVRYPWPGNVRELENAIERAVVLARGPTLTPEDFPLEISGEEREAEGGFRLDFHPDGRTIVPLKKALEGPEREIIAATLASVNWNRQKAAKLLDINRTTLFNKMRKYGLLEIKRGGRRRG